MANIYDTFFTIFNNYIFNGAVLTDTSYEHLMCVILATIGTLMTVYLPFCIVRWIFRGIAK